MKQTAVEWLIEQFNSKEFMYGDRTNIIEQAKEMEKEQERMYSEKEVIELLNNFRIYSYNHGCGSSEFLEWFEQFKKK